MEDDTKLDDEEKQNERMILVSKYDLMLKAGIINDIETESQYIRSTLAEFEFYANPVSGWIELTRKMIFTLLEDDESEPFRFASAREIAKNCNKNADDLLKVARKMTILSWNRDISELEFIKDLNFQNILPDLYTASIRLKALGAHFAKVQQPSKWRASRMRSRRTELARLLSPIFEHEFGVPARPSGGSAARSLSEANAWTRFYQGMAFVRLGERATPDIQAILWEACKSLERR